MIRDGIVVEVKEEGAYIQYLSSSSHSPQTPLVMFRISCAIITSPTTVEVRYSGSIARHNARMRDGTRTGVRATDGRLELPGQLARQPDHMT